MAHNPLTNVYLAKLAREDFLTYAMLTEKSYHVAKLHRVFGDMIMRIRKTLETPRGELYLIITVPPRHGKTKTFAELMTTWLMSQLPGLGVIYATHTKSFAEKVGTGLRDVFFGKQYKAIAQEQGFLRPDEKSKSRMRLNNGSSWLGVGSSGNITGFGGSLIIADDLIKSRKDAESKRLRDEIYTYFQQTLGSRLQPYSKDGKPLGKVKVVIMQRWHEDDLVGKLLAEQAKLEARGNEARENWEVINFEAIATQDQHYNGKLFRKEGEALWPEMYDLDALATIKSRSLYAWASQYQQDPILSELQVFKESLFQYYSPSDEEFVNATLDYYTLVDLASSQEEDADNTVVLTVAKERHGHKIYRIEEHAGKFAPKKTIDLIFEHYQKYKSHVVIEQIAWQKAIGYLVKDEQVRRGIYFKIHETKRGNKEERIGVGLLSLYQNGIIYHRKGTQDKDYEMELMQFPRGKHDDRADVMSFVIDAIRETSILREAKIVKAKVHSYLKKRW